MSRRLTAAAAGLLTAASIATVPAAAAASLPPAAASSAALTNLAHLDFLTTIGDPTAASRAHHLPARQRALGWSAVGLRQLPGPRQLPGHRRRHLRPREQHLRAGRLRRRRHLPRRGRLPAALDAIRRPAQPRRGLPAAARADLPADRIRAQRRQRRAVDAARREPQPHPHPRRLTESLRLGRLVLAGPHHLGARRRLCRLPQRRPRLRRLPPAAPGPGHRSARPGSADQLRAVRPVERAACASMADHRRCRCQFGGRARPGCLRPGGRQRRRPQPRSPSLPTASPAWVPAPRAPGRTGRSCPR